MFTSIKMYYTPQKSFKILKVGLTIFFMLTSEPESVRPIMLNIKEHTEYEYVFKEVNVNM